MSRPSSELEIRTRAAAPFAGAAPVGDVAADIALCRATIRTGSRSFYAASLLLPSALRDAACVVYAFCRLSDDAIDLGGGDLEAVARLRGRLARIYAGKPDATPVDRALSRVVADHQPPRAALEALLEGLEWDARSEFETRRYETLPDLLAYCARVAGSVGAVMAALMDVREPGMAARACDLGAAMQLTNIARDVGEDARAGRLYLPVAWLRAAGVDPDAFLKNPQPTPEIRAVTARLLAEADRLYRRAEPGLRRLPLSCRPAMWAARLIYADIGREIARNGYDSVSRRAHTSAGRKVALLALACWRAARPGWWWTVGAVDADALPEMRYLVDAVAASSTGRSARAAPLDMTVERFIAILGKLNDLERAGQSAPPRR